MKSEDLIHIIRIVKKKKPMELSAHAWDLVREYVDKHEEEIRQYILDKLNIELKASVESEIEERRSWLKEST